jgi:hypothetical protein
MHLVSWKSRSAIATAAMLTILAPFAAAQDTLEKTEAAAAAQATTKPASGDKSGAKPDADARTLEQSAFDQGSKAAALGFNVRFDITITDQAGSNPPTKKTLNVIAANRSSGAIRSKVAVAIPSYTPPGQPSRGPIFEDLPLNLDFKVDHVEGARIRALVGLNYETFMPVTVDDRTWSRRSAVTMNQTVILESGKPTIVSQSADAATDRKVTVEVTATLMR